jgi:hypothetical protein
MKQARKFRFWLGGLFSKGKFNADMEDEMRLHLEPVNDNDPCPTDDSYNAPWKG